MKPQNILVSADGKISVVDLDSIQISNSAQVIHRGHVATPEYTPAEGGRLNPSQDFIPETWDRFSLAIIFYELIFGLHPFVATSTGQYEHITTIDEAIKHGLFVFGSKSQFLKLPPLHQNFHRLPDSIKNCFLKAFDKGHTNPNVRPTAEEWGKALFEELRLEVEKTNINCPVCSQLIVAPKHKHVQLSCAKCKTKVEVKNGSIIGYVSEKIIIKKAYVDKPIEKIVEVKTNNPFSVILNVALGLVMLFGYSHYNSQLNKMNDSSSATLGKIQTLEKEKESLKQEKEKLQAENKALDSKISKISNIQPFIIESIDFSNDTKNGTNIDDYSNSFSYGRIRYISPRLKITPLIRDGYLLPKAITLYIKCIDASGRINRNSSISPKGYTYTSSVDVSSSSEYLYIGGWGNDSGDLYETGKHKVEIWYEGRLLGVGSFNVTY